MSWHFRQMMRTEINADPTEGDFFNVEALPNLADALVRESIQNSLDAGSSSNGAAVEVKIKISTEDEALNPSKAARFFENLLPHLEATELVNQLPENQENISWIAVEDFQTKGLVGDVRACEDPETGRNDFFYFWRNIGRGKKAGSERGRWGLGKTMFPSSSRIHSFFGLTVREDDEIPLLMGQSVLKIHHLEGVKRYPYGYFGVADPKDGFVTPFDDEDLILNFVELFGLTRINEPGLSVVVPYPRGSIGKEEIVSSVIKHYFFPILGNGLIVEIDYGEEHIELNAENLINKAGSLLGGEEFEFKGLIELARKFIEMDSCEFINAQTQEPRRAPRWSDDLFTPSTLAQMTADFDAGKTVVIKTPVHVVPKGEEPRLSHFHLVIERDPELEVAQDVYVRQGITISGVTSLRDSGVRALVIASDDELATFLGDSENPAHTEWQERSRKFKGKYHPGPATLQFVKEAPRQMMRLINRHAEHVDDTALRHIFPEQSDSGSPRRRQAATQVPDPTQTHVPTPDLKTRTPRIAMNRTSHGFSIVLTEFGKTNLPDQIVVKCAYDTGRGNPFRKWSVADFDFTTENEITLQVVGGSVSAKHANALNVKVDNGEFRLNATGFDENRDLITDVRTVSSNA